MRTITRITKAGSVAELLTVQSQALKQPNTSWTPEQFLTKVKQYNQRLGAKLAKALRPEPKGLALVPKRRGPAPHPDNGKVLHRYGLYGAVLTPLAGGPVLKLNISAEAKQFPRKERVELDLGANGKLPISLDAWTCFLLGEGTRVVLHGAHWKLQQA